MDVHDAAQARRMVRSFSERPVAAAVLDELLTDALRAPTAGHAQGTAWVVLQGPDETTAYWHAATTASWRERSARWPGLSRAPVVAVALGCPPAYVARYAEPDKARAAHGVALGETEAAWPVPYWHGDAAFGVMTLLLGAASAGLGACFLGNFRGEGGVLAALGVPEGWRLFGAVVLGHPAGDDTRSASLTRPGPGVRARVHYGGWAQ
ncbi:MAG: nitroreductase family protein [Acidimicrobiales bacterium]